MVKCAWKDENKQNLLHLVARYGGEYENSVALMERMYQSEWLNAKSSGGTPIMMAYSRYTGTYSNECARFLLNKGADISYKSSGVECIFSCAFSINLKVNE